MTILLELEKQQSERLIELAAVLQVDPAELAKAAICDFTTRRGSDFQQIMNRMLEKNRELYRRLS